MAFQTPSRFSASDFKEMLKTPSGSLATAAGGTRRGAGVMKPPPAPQQKKQQPQKKKQHHHQQQHRHPRSTSSVSRSEASSSLATPYRDRVAERNRGSNPDYEDDFRLIKEAGLTPSLAQVATPAFSTASAAAQFATPASQRAALAGIVAKQGTIPNPEEEDAAVVAERRQRAIYEEIEKSKFLGGDEKHTHLVKGLDYVLLQKEQARIREIDAKKQAEKERAEAAEALRAQKEKERQGKAATLLSSSSAGTCIEFTTSLGRQVYEVWQTGIVSRSSRKGSFAAADTSFVFSSAEEELPRTVVVGGGGDVAAAALLRSRTSRSKVGKQVVACIARIIEGRERGDYATMKLKKQKEEERLASKVKERVEDEEKVEEEEEEEKGCPQPPPGTKGIFDMEEEEEGVCVPLPPPSRASTVPLASSLGAAATDGGSDQEDDIADVIGALVEDPHKKAGKKPAQEHHVSQPMLGRATTFSSVRAATSRVDVDSEYAECFPDTWGGPDKSGFAAGLEEVDEFDIEEDRKDALRRGTADPKERYKEEQRKRARAETELKAVYKKMESKKRAANRAQDSQPQQQASKKPKPDRSIDPVL